MAIDYGKFDEKFDLEGLAKDVTDADNGESNYKEVPHGNYEVAVNKLELTESKKGDPMVSIWFKIVEGEYKNSQLFYNQVITQGFQIHLVNDLLRKLNSGVDVSWPGTYAEFGQMLMDIREAIDKRFEYGIAYTANKKNSSYNDYDITDVFELED